MTLIELLLLVTITAIVCGFAGLSSTTTVLVTLGVSSIAILFSSVVFPSPWRPIERLKGKVPNDHPLIVKAKQRAADSLSLFWSLCADGVPSDAKVRVHLTNRGGESEELWMFLLDVPDAEGRIHVHWFDRPQLLDHESYDTDLDFHVHENQIGDWSLEQSGGHIRGDFTTFALFRFLEQSDGPIPKRTKALQERFMDARSV